MENDNVKLKNEKRVAIILVNYKDYAEKYLVECLASLRQQDYVGGLKIFITDNESTGQSYNYLKQASPEAEIISNQNNDGFAKGNNDAMKVALTQGFEYIILFNLDTILEPDCVRKMVKAAEDKIPLAPARKASLAIAGGPFVKGGNSIGAVQARLMLWPEKEKINSLGNVTHFLGFGYTEGYREEYRSPRPPRKQGVAGAAPPPFVKGGIKEICYPSGAAVLFKAEVLEKVGLFDEEFWMYNEDQDLGWRIWLAGWSCILAPDAVVYHKYEFSRSIKKYYWLDRNRIIAILKNYRSGTLILIFPAFIFMEIGLIFFAYKNGWFYEKMKVYSYFINSVDWRKILDARKKVQESRTISDRRVIKMFSGKIWYQEIGETRLKVANVIFNAYWQIIKVFIRW